MEPLDSTTSLRALPGREPALRRWLAEHGTLMAAAEAHPDAVALEGRGRVAVVPGPAVPEGAPAERWVVRHYHRGGAVASAMGDRYLRLGAPRPFRELGMLEAVRALGVPAPAPVGAAVYFAGPFYRGDLVTVWVPDSIDLATLLFPPPAGAPPVAAAPADAGVAGHADAMRAAGRLVRLLHDRGVVHPDLNLKNVLLAAGVDGTGGDGEPRALVLDLDRATLGDGAVPDRARRAMLDRFWRSARKWERRAGRALPASLRPSFEEGYAAGYPEGHPDRHTAG
jgi:3-deoxy-D-manno-octulosonic acid kinase